MAIEAPVHNCTNCCISSRSEQVACERLDFDGVVARKITTIAYGARMTSMSLTPIEKCYLRKTAA